MTTKINDIWKEMESDYSGITGFLFRRYSAEVIPDLFVALQQPEKFRCIAVRLRTNKNIDLSRYNSLSGLNIAIIADGKGMNNVYLLVKLTESNHRDVFSVLCEDLISIIRDVLDEDRVVKGFVNRFEKWKSLFDRISQQGLTPPEQQGLYGELFFLRKWISELGDSQRCIKAWLGPEKDLRDFQLDTWGLEVKTTHGNNHQRVQISNERQLDTANIPFLFLYHLSLEIQQQSGENLIQIVDSIFAILESDVAAQNQFRTKLYQWGYFSHHNHLYIDTGYHVRQDTYYRVHNEFPRIEERDIRSGVGDVKYSIILSSCADYQTTQNLVFETIK